MGSAWNTRMSVGNGIIDSEHRNLLEMASRIESMIERRDASTMSDELDQFEEWLRTHFENEEAIGRKIGFNTIPNHTAHRKLMSAFRLMKGALTACGDTLPESAAKHYSNFLSEWLEDHIVDEDMSMKPVLQTHPYDFVPDNITQ